MADIREHRQLVWSDEFDGPAGSPPDLSSWGFELGDGSADGNPGWGNAELQWYTDNAANVSQDGRGNLAVTACTDAERGYTSARLVTKGKMTFRYGRIETRARVPRGAGLWSAVWALGANIDEAPWPRCGEIDVMEHVGKDGRRVFGTVHGPGYAGAAGVGGGVYLTEDPTDGFHVFAAEWTARRIEWSVDDHIYHAVTPHDVPGAWVFDHPAYLLVNLAVGGTLAGPVDADMTFPRELLLDYLRVYTPLA
jgi:beta-glucanase (GH16 family)